MNHLFKNTLSILFITCTQLAASHHHAIMSYDEYAATRHARLISYVLKNNASTIFYFGANHSCTPCNEQYPLLRQFWSEFLETTHGENCTVLVEGSLRREYDNEDDAIMYAGGEGGLLTYFARQHNIPILCPEPTPEQLQAQLLEQFSPKELAYREFGHIGQQYHRYKKNNPDLDFEKFYDKYNEPISFDEIKTIHTTLFSTPLDVQDEQWFYDISNPVVIKSRMNELNRAASRMRDEAIVDQIAQLQQQGKHIFIAYGRTHAIMQKPALENLYQKESK